MSTETHPESIVTPQQCNHSGPASQAIYEHVRRLLGDRSRWTSVSDDPLTLEAQLPAGTLRLEDQPCMSGYCVGVYLGDHIFTIHDSDAFYLSKIMCDVYQRIAPPEANTAAQKFLDLLTQPATR